MKRTRRIALPAIYRFEFPGDPIRSKWGWHRAVELMEALDSICHQNNRLSVGPRRIARDNPHLSPLPLRDVDLFRQFKREPYFVVTKDESLARLSSGPDGWLVAAVDHDSYLPARLGMRLIRAFKHPHINAARRTVSNKG